GHALVRLRRPTAPLLAAVLQILVGNRKDGAGLDLDVPHEALPRIWIANLGIVMSRLNARYPQALVVVNFLVLVVQGLVWAPFVLGGRRQLKARNGCGRKIPKPDAFSLRAELAGAHYHKYNQRQYAPHRVTSQTSVKPPERCRKSKIHRALACRFARDANRH